MGWQPNDACDCVATWTQKTLPQLLLCRHTSTRCRCPNSGSFHFVFANGWEWRCAVHLYGPHWFDFLFRQLNLVFPFVLVNLPLPQCAFVLLPQLSEFFIFVLPFELGLPLCYLDSRLFSLVLICLPALDLFASAWVDSLIFALSVFTIHSSPNDLLKKLLFWLFLCCLTFFLFFMCFYVH